MELEQLQLLISDPRETLATELKEWIDPETDEGKAKIIQACIALRNYNGGNLIFGFNDDGRPCGPAPYNVREKFSADAFQQLISKHCSESFVPNVIFIERDGVEYPVIEIPSGVESPVAVKSGIESRDSSQRMRLPHNAVYIRTLESNGTFSSSQPTHKDWPAIVRICFDNREADIGKFARRHLQGLDLSRLLQALGVSNAAPVTETAAQKAVSFLESAHNRYERVSLHTADSGKIGTFEFALAIDGATADFEADEEFYRAFQSGKPKHSGWSMWVGGNSVGDSCVVQDNQLESFIDRRAALYVYDFWIANPTGKFYLLRALPDDLAGRNGIPPGKFLDHTIVISRVAELLSVALHFARVFGASMESGKIGVATRWSGLGGRCLYAWTKNAGFTTHESSQDEITTSVEMLPQTPESALPPVVRKLVAPLFNLFGATRVSDSLIESQVKETLETRF